MKELTIEQKAQRYDEAIKRYKAKQEYESQKVHEFIEYLFPELKENEDEKTKRILHSISSKMSFHLRDIFTEEEFHCFDTWSYVWLNKQSEKKESYIDMSLVDAVRFCVADNLAHKSTDDNGNTIGFDVYIDDTTAQKLTNELSDIFQKPIEWSEEDKTRLDKIVTHLKGMVSVSDIDFLKSLKDRVQPQPKQEWSEEDEKIRTLLINILEVNHPNGCFKVNPANTLNMEAMHTEELVNWLKSIRFQNTWKPSGGQMKYLAKAIMTLGNEGNNKASAILYELWIDLKKLKD